jgi:hypothetical protein
LFLSFSIAVFCQPRIEISGGTRYQLGMFDEGEKIVRVFLVKNIGTDTLVIDDVSTSCGCAVAEETEFHVPPKDSARLKIIIDTNELSGPVKKEVYIESNDPQRNELTITLNAFIRPVIEVEPRYISFVYSQLGEVVLKTVYLTNRTKVPMTISSISIPDSEVSADVNQKVLFPDNAVELTVKFTPKTERKYLGQISLITDSPQKNEIRISYVSAMKKGH